MIARLIFAVVFGLVPACAVAGDPPTDLAVFRTLHAQGKVGRAYGLITRDDHSIDKTELDPKCWQCTVSFSEYLWTPWGRVFLRIREHTITTAPAIPDLRRPTWK